MKREDALKKLNYDPINNNDIKKELQYVANKLNISQSELESFFKGKNKSFRDYKSNFKIINFFTKILTILGIEKRVIQ